MSVQFADMSLLKAIIVLKIDSFEISIFGVKKTVS